MSGEIADKLAAIHAIHEQIEEHQKLAKAALEKSQHHTDEAVRLQGEAAALMHELTGDSTH